MKQLDPPSKRKGSTVKWHWNHAYKTFHRVVEVHNTRVRVTINQQSNSNSNLNLNCLFNIGMLKARDWERYTNDKIERKIQTT